MKVLSLFKEKHHRLVFIGKKAIDQSFVACLTVSAISGSINDFLVNLEHFKHQNAIFVQYFWASGNFIKR